MIITPRLYLQPATRDLLRAELEQRAEFRRLLGVHVPDEWPPELYDADAIRFTLRQYEVAPASEAWWVHYCVLRDGSEPTLIGVTGYKGPPSAGCVEVGYGILPQYRRMGYATEATSGMVAHAFATPGVNRVAAETYPHLTASIGVMVKCGFVFVGEGAEPGVIRYEVTREDWSGRTGSAVR